MGQGAGRALNRSFIPVDNDFEFRRWALVGAVRQGVIDHHGSELCLSACCHMTWF